MGYDKDARDAWMDRTSYFLFGWRDENRRDENN
jgi:hypothetical protein